MARRKTQSRGWDTRKVNDTYLEDKDVPKWIESFVRVTKCRTLPKLVSVADRLHITKRMIEQALPQAGFKVVKEHRWDILKRTKPSSVAPTLSEESEPAPAKPRARPTVKPTDVAGVLTSGDLEMKLGEHRKGTHIILDQRMKQEAGFQEQLIKLRLVEKIGL